MKRVLKVQCNNLSNLKCFLSDVCSSKDFCNILDEKCPGGDCFCGSSGEKCGLTETICDKVVDECFKSKYLDVIFLIRFWNYS